MGEIAAVEQDAGDVPGEIIRFAGIRKLRERSEAQHFERAMIHVSNNGHLGGDLRSIGVHEIGLGVVFLTITSQFTNKKVLVIVGL